MPHSKQLPYAANTSTKEETQPFTHSTDLLVTSYVPGAGDTENERQDASLIRPYALSGGYRK